MAADSQERLRSEPPEDLDIEILEVVGLDDEAPPASADDDHEVEVTFEETEPDTAADPATATAPSPYERHDVVARERLLRMQADFENLRKRVERERDEFHRYATAGLITRLLSVLDNIDRALLAPRRPGEDGLREGIELTRRQLFDDLSREGLRAVPAVGLVFDPELHDAVATGASSGHPAGTVLEELRRGYVLHNRLLRPALVRVAVEESAADASPGDREESCNG